MLLCALAFASGLALADEQLDRVSTNVESLEDLIVGLEARIAGDHGLVENAEQRFEDALFARMTGDHLTAAEGFFLLARVLEDDGLRRDAQWYLADSLYEIGSVDLAEETLLEIDADPTHVFREAASLRLLDLYADNNRQEDFLAYYAGASDHIESTDALTYTLGKCFYKLGQHDRAHELLKNIPSGSEHYGRARYVLGTIHVVEGDLEEAATHFKDNLSLSIDTKLDRQVHDQTLLALARVAYQQGEYGEASEYYAKIDGDSEYLADQLYEEVWTHVRLEDDLGALVALELFLLHFPDHPAGGRLRLARGHLQMRQRDWEAATEEYEHVLAEYKPLRGADYADLPVWLQNQVSSDPDVAAANNVVATLEEQAAELEAAEELVEELSSIIAGKPILKRHHEQLVETAIGLKISLVLSMNVLSVDARSLPSSGKEGRTRVAELKSRRAKLIGKLKRVVTHDKLPAAEARAATESLLSLRDKIITQWEAQKEVRAASRKPQPNQEAETMIRDLDALGYRLDAAFHTVQAQSEKAREPLLESLAREAAAIETATLEHKELVRSSESVLHAAERRGAAALDGYLVDAIRQADMGLVDASWNELLDTVQLREDALIDRAEKLNLLRITAEALRKRVR